MRSMRARDRPFEKSMNDQHMSTRSTKGQKQRAKNGGPGFVVVANE